MPSGPSKIIIVSESILVRLIQALFSRIDKNNLQGTLPTDELSTLSSLERILMNNNGISGTVSSKLGSLQRLEQLKLALNSMSGTIPEELGDLKELQILDFRGTKGLTGTLPASLGALTNMTVLSVADNMLSGTVPLSYSNLTALGKHNRHAQLLSTSFCRTFSHFCYALLISTEQFWIYSNQITGSVNFLCETIEGPNIAADCEFNEVICSCNCTCFA
jgi:Leucine-rich repeat (LRR) protein